MTCLTPATISEMLNMSIRWVYLHASELGASRIGKTWIFTQEGLEDALQKPRGMEGNSQDKWIQKASVVSIKDGKQ
jgi:hypothetical protein